QADLLVGELASAALDLHHLAAGERQVARAAAESQSAALRPFELGPVLGGILVEVPKEMIEHEAATLERRIEAAREAALMLKAELGELPPKMPRKGGHYDTAALREIATGLAKGELGRDAANKLVHLLGVRGDIARWAPSWCQSLINARRAELADLLEDVERTAELRASQLAALP